MKPGLLAIAVSAVLLAACGDSDLPEHHMEILAEEQRKQEQRELDAANSANEDTFVPVEIGDEEEEESESEEVTNNASAVEEGSDEEEAGEEDIEEAEEEEESTIDETEAPEEGDELAETSEEEESANTTDDLDLDNDFTLVFSDEFNGDSVDFSKWKTALEWGPDLVVNEELQYYVDTESQPAFGYDPFNVIGGVLDIMAVPTPASLSDSANGQTWLSGVLSTADHFNMRYGYVEARMDFPAGSGLWSSFWMLSSDYNATSLRPRVFVSEFDGGRPNSVYHNYQYEDSDGAVRSPGQFQADENGLDEGFHTVGLSWTPDELVYYVDGEPRYRVVGDRLPQQDMYLILNQAVGGVWVNDPNGSTQDPAILQVDYVRIYERNAN